MDGIFNLCVKILLVLADLFGTSYKAVNVWIFVILWPAFTVLLVAVVCLQRRRIRRLRSQLCNRETTGASPDKEHAQ